MQLRKMMVMLAALSSMSLALTACGDDATTVESCTSDTDCSSNFCNTAAGVCMDTCESGSDCADSEKNCAVLAGSSNTQKVCQCQTNQLCNSGDTTDLVCGTVSKRCEEPGSTPEGCTKDADCGAGNTCNTTTGVCSPAATTCTGEGKATCAYGSACYSGTCSAPPAPTCENYQNFGNKAALGTTGPIIFKVATTSAEPNSTFCANAGASTKRVKITISAYADTAWPATSAGLNGFLYVLVNGTAQAPSISSSSGNYTVSGNRADIVANLCVLPSSNTASLGYYFTGGNFACHQANY
ncbi:hypothetical protein HRD49_12515 [Corallococcus exiguus]|uniref:hypothetical protein n=1 Tax=Corallococcus exiguus TaxID=83462 RepID=UPI001471DA47|nr:hypothetical protein [Corallococcus exiguus]NNC15453.1 hypothetical protein [Corallococcus exiguus]NRD62567.1 hypothetical protein [Corallococcus exiguus]